jgi:class 3 adenylate cyclase
LSGRTGLISSEAAGRALTAVDRVLTAAASEGERAASWARLVLCCAVLAVWVPILVRLGRPGDFISVGVCALGVVHAVLVLVRLGRGPASHRLLVSSALTEGALVGGVVIGWFAVREADWLGIPKLTASWVGCLSLFVGGLRLSRRVVLYSAVMHAAWVVPLAFLDQSVTTGSESLGRDWAVYLTFLTCSALMAFFVAKRTRALALDVAAESRTREKTRALLGAYVSEELAEAALERGELTLGGERAVVTVLFSDLRGFTSYAEGLAPEDLVRQLNAYLAAMVNVISAHGGVVDKYVGDAIMAVFGAPAARPDDAARAIRAAHAMRGALAEHNQARALREEPPLRQGIGVHTGPVVAGNVGTAARASYTVIGDTVNLASRLEAATKERGVEVLVSEDAVQAAWGARDDLPALEDAGELEVRGRSKPVQVLTLRG